MQGQLGGRSELIEAYEIFKNTWVDDKQEAIEEVFNTINEYRGVGEATIIPKEPVGLDVFGNNKLFELLPKKFIYEKIGINPDDYPELEEEQQAKAEEKQAIAEAKKPEVKKEEKKEEKFSDVLAHFAEMGEPQASFIVVKKKKTLFTEDHELEALEQLSFSEVSRDEAGVLDLIKKDKRITPEVLAQTLNVPVSYVNRLLESLERKGILKVKTETIGEDVQIERTVKETPKIDRENRPLTTEVFIKYSYEGPKDDRNRDFCARLLELDRFYSRAEIEQISQRVGYSVWERRGGFYHNPNTDTTTPYCRHRWVQNIVIKKK